jgi:glycosyltransferase involved in cell wall biosynthesis
LRDWDVASVIARGSYEALWLHGYNFLTHQVAIATQRLCGRPVLLREDQTLLHGRPPLKAAIKAAVLPLLFSQVRGLYVGTENRRWFTRYGVKPDRLHFTPYSVDNDRLREAADRLTPRRAALRAELGVADDSGPVILTVSRLIPKKQPLALLDAFALLRQRVRCTLMIVGSGSLEQQVRRRAAQISDVVVAGFMNQSEIVRAYASSDIFTLFSRCHETWGFAVNEAMNFALPIVVSDKVGCAADLIKDGTNGFVVDHRDPAALAERLQQLVETQTLRSQMGAASAYRVSQWNYDIASGGVVEAVRAAVGELRWGDASNP